MASRYPNDRRYNGRNQAYNPRRRRDTRPFLVRHWGVVMLTLVFIVCACFQLRAMAQLSAQQKQIAQVTAEIHRLESLKSSLAVDVNTMKQAVDLEARAKALGMVRPEGDSIRTVYVQMAGSGQNTNAQTAMNGAEND